MQRTPSPHHKGTNMNDELQTWGGVLAGLVAAAGLAVRWARGQARKSEATGDEEGRPQPQDGGPRPVRPRAAQGEEE